MSEPKTLSEFDLLAYADGRLEHSPAYKAELEAALAESPEERARLEAYRAQTEALRAAYGERIAEPVPERLAAALEEPAPRWRPRPAMAAAASLALALLAGVGGWSVAQWQTPGGGAKALLEASYRDFTGARVEAEGAREERVGPVSQRTLAGRGAGLAEGALSGLSEEISLTLRAPDLSDRGYDIVDKETIARGGNETVRLTYANASGETFGLYLRPRWQERGGSLNIDRRGEVSLGYWLDGPLAAAVASRRPPEETKELAETVRAQMRRSAPESPEIRLPHRLELEAGRQDEALEVGATAPISRTTPQREQRRDSNGGR